LEKSLAQVKEATAHLKGLKIAVMGCIVNGPGEMADADYGYVGAGPGKVSLYKGKELVKRSVDAENAVEELLRLIEQDQQS
jgi:(E)-4-hydroxy-3-methylbut-2-enyl-diphosphate synthase